MLADVLDYEEASNRRAAGGVYAAALGLCERMGYSVGALLSGFILVGTGFDVRLGGGRARHAALIRLLYSALPFLGAAGAVLIINRYPLSEGLTREIQHELQQRRRPA